MKQSSLDMDGSFIALIVRERMERTDLSFISGSLNVWPQGTLRIPFLTYPLHLYTGSLLDRDGDLHGNPGVCRERIRVIPELCLVHGSYPDILDVPEY